MIIKFIVDNGSTIGSTVVRRACGHAHSRSMQGVFNALPLLSSLGSAFIRLNGPIDLSVN